MLFQLVCTDRRYARMNCFNIRELQSVLKRKFFTDLVSSHDYRDLLTQSMLGLRFKLNSNNLISADTLSFHDFGLKNSDLNKFSSFGSSIKLQETATQNRVTLGNYINQELLVSGLRTLLKNSAGDSILKDLTINLKNEMINLFRCFYSLFNLCFISLLEILPSTGFIINFIFNNLFINFMSMHLTNIFSFVFNTLSIKFSPLNNTRRGASGTELREDVIDNYYYLSSESGTFDKWEKLSINNSFSETIDASQRFNRFNNSLINYDYKTGNYVGYWEGKYPHLVNTFIEIARGVKKPT